MLSATTLEADPMDQSTSARSPALTYDGQLDELYGIFLMNLLWTVLTLGIFRFWAITRIRRYLWSRTRFQGERFEYTGTGGELFIGVLLAILMLIGALWRRECSAPCYMPSGSRWPQWRCCCSMAGSPLLRPAPCSRRSATSSAGPYGRAYAVA